MFLSIWRTPSPWLMHWRPARSTRWFWTRSLSRGLMSKGFSLLLDLFQANVFFPGLGVGVTRAYLEKSTTHRRESCDCLDGKARVPFMCRRTSEPC